MEKVTGEDVQQDGVQLGFNHDGHGLFGTGIHTWQPQNIHAATLDHMILVLGAEQLLVGIKSTDAKALYILAGQLRHHDSAGQSELLVLAVLPLDRR